MASVVVAICGMQPEWNIVKQVFGVSAAYGIARDDLNTIVPASCIGLMSFGVCGGLDPQFKRGMLCIPRTVVTARTAAVDNIACTSAAPGWVRYTTDPAWRGTLQQTLTTMPGAVTTASCLSDKHVWAIDPPSRAALYARTGCAIIDNESWSVAQYAAAHKLPFTVLRAISDESDDTVINDPQELNPDGSPNILIDIRDFIENPALIIHEALGFAKALDTLRTAVSRLGPMLKL